MLNKLLFLSKSSFSAFQILEQSFLFFFYNKQILHIFKSHFHVILLFVSALLLSPKLIFLFTFWLIYLLLSTWVRTLVNLYASFANFPSHFFPPLSLLLSPFCKYCDFVIFAQSERKRRKT